MATTLTTSYQRISTISVTYGEIRTYAKYNSQSIDNNTTTISLKTTYYLSQWISFSSGTSTLDGTSKSYGSTRFNAGETTLQEFTRTLTHNADGTSPTKNVATSWTATFGGGGSTSADVVAPTIPRASQPSCITYPNTTSDVGNIGGTFTIHMNRKSTSFTHTVRYSWYNKSGTIATGVTDNCQWTIPNDFAADIPNAKKSWGTIYADTYNGNTFIGTKSVVFWCNVSDADPTFNVAYLDTNPTTTAITGNNQQIIRNNSTLRVNITNAEAKKYATLSSAKVVINGATYNGTFSGSSATFNIGTLNISSNTTATVTVTDSRGISTTKNLTLQVLDWVLPSAIITAERENNFYDPTTINVDATYSSLDGLNTLTIQMRYKKTTDADYGSYQTLQDNTPVTVQLDNNHEWNLQVLLTDRLGSKTYNLIVSRGMPIVFFDRKRRSMSVDKFPSHDATLEVAGNLHVNSLTRNTTDTWMVVVGPDGRMDYTQRKFSTSKTHTDYNNNQDYVPTLSFLSFWNGAYNSGGSSNLTYAHQGEIQCKPTTLWTNSNPSAAFGSQTINISNLSNYKYIDIIYYPYYPGSSAIVKVERHYYDTTRKVGQISGPFRYNNDMFYGTRDYTVNASNIVFGVGKSNNNTTDNNWYKPYQIIGYR